MLDETATSGTQDTIKSQTAKTRILLKTSTDIELIQAYLYGRFSLVM